MDKKLKILLIADQCNPQFTSWPLVSYNYYKELCQHVDVTLVTHERNKVSLKDIATEQKIIYIPDHPLIKKVYPLIAALTGEGNFNWPLYHLLTYPIYADFNNKVYQQFKQKIYNGEYDIVHASFCSLPRYPVKLIKACHKTPFILGPLNGGIPFPKGRGFKKIAFQEAAFLNFLRSFTVLIPGYVDTYQKADKIIASPFTSSMLKKLLKLEDHQLEQFRETGVSKEFLSQRKEFDHPLPIQIIFCGRLVPYKGADMLIEAVSKLDPSTKSKIKVIIIGDGPQKDHLKKQIKALNLDKMVSFTGKVEPSRMSDLYKKSDIFCFPSIREFGGQVVVDAMAHSLPCIVVDYGGTGESVSDEAGFKIKPVSRPYIIDQLTNKMELLINDPGLRKNMSQKAFERAREFTWDKKTERILAIYEDVLKNKL